MKIDAKKYIKFFEYIILIIIFLGSFWLYIKMFFSSALMCFTIGLYDIFALETLAFFNLLVDNDNDVIKLGYILFVGGAVVLYLVYLHIG